MVGGKVKEEREQRKGGEGEGVDFPVRPDVGGVNAD